MRNLSWTWICCTLVSPSSRENMLHSLHSTTKIFQECLSMVQQSTSIIEKTNLSQMRVEFFKRANGWRPFLYNITVNLCDMLLKKKLYHGWNMISLNLIWSIFGSVFPSIQANMRHRLHFTTKMFEKLASMVRLNTRIKECIRKSQLNCKKDSFIICKL